uniref:Uncharacterized protein n=1 Tax=Tetranychus urticae TaxID=32264 RepID=T1K8B4_TETUR
MMIVYIIFFALIIAAFVVYLLLNFWPERGIDTSPFQCLACSDHAAASFMRTIKSKSYVSYLWTLSSYHRVRRQNDDLAVFTDLLYCHGPPKCDCIEKLMNECDYSRRWVYL